MAGGLVTPMARSIIVGGMDPVTVARLTGTSLEMISQTYGHLVQDAAREKLAKLEFV